jgi:hypothetical protein
MGQITWQAAVDGRYWIDVAVGSLDLLCLLDTGLIDPLDRLAFELEPDEYDKLLGNGDLQYPEYRTRRDASGNLIATQAGFTEVYLIDPVTRVRVGSRLGVYVSRGTSGVPSRVGIVFCHRLVGCQANWDLGLRRLVLTYP